MKMQRRHRHRGFTLIELLIVVAIIAILAAIAVPNFLEAQVRSKVSRVKADQRTIATAQEAYYVDNNHYPPQGPVTLGAFPWIDQPSRIYGGDGPNHQPGNQAINYKLSTPIAYLTSTQSVFADPFFAGFDPTNTVTSLVNDTRYYNYSGDYLNGRTYDSAQDGSVSDFLATSQALQAATGWHLRSRGPDSDYEKRSAGWADWILYHGTAGTGIGGAGGKNILYDASNGTVSNGDIVRLGKGGVSN